MQWPQWRAWLPAIRNLIRGASPAPPDPPLLRELWQVHEHIACLQNQFDHVDRDLVEYVIFKLNAAERLMATLWQAARRENLVAWEGPLHPVMKVAEE